MVTCPACGRENPVDASFCNGCGAPLAAVSGAAREERKVVTVLFADLVGFTSRAERMDPEDVRALLAPYWERLRGELERFGGTVEKFIGDAVMALFGAPVAHEDDPERAVRAALAIRDWARDAEEELQVRIAVNTGEVLVLLGARPSEGEGMAAGDVVNTAARLQAAAPVNGVLVGETTYRATRHVIDYVEAEPVAAKGKSAPLPVWEAVAARSRPTIETMSAGPLVGRAAELELLIGALQRARREREPQFVTVAGVPGIGKSRLVAELYAFAEADPELITWRRGRSLSYGDNVSLWALGEIVKAELGVLASDSRAETAAKLASSLEDLTDDPSECAWIGLHLEPLVGLPGQDVDRSQSPAARRRWIELLADRRPLVLVFEDLQWADDELLDFVDQLVDWLSGIPLLVVCTTRPELFERRPGWGGGKRNAFAISLGPLGDVDTARIVATSLDQALLPAETQAGVLRHADGNPLYAEQYARMIAEGAHPDAVPENVQGLVAARLDLLAAEEKSLLQDAAVIGRIFWPGAIGAPEERLHTLVRKEFIRRERRSSIAGEPEYSFAHALVRDVAYAQIPRAARAERHRRAAEWIDSLPADRAADRAELIAHHYVAALELAEAAALDASHLREPARRAFRDAASRAFSLNAMPAAERFYTAALELWPTNDPERATLLLARAETRLLVGGDAVGDAEEAVAAIAGSPEEAAEAELTLARAYWADGSGIEAADHAERALELVRDLPPSRVQAAAVVERARLLMLRGDRALATELATKGLALSEAVGSEHLQASALITRGTCNLGENGFADLQEGIAIATRIADLDQLYRGLNNSTAHHGRRGDIRAQLAVYTQLRDLARGYGHATQLSWVDAQETIMFYVVGDWDGALECAERRIASDSSIQSHSAYMIRADIRHARGEAGAREDGERAVAAARRSGDIQSVAPVLAAEARRLALDGERTRARQLFEEVLDAYAAVPSGPLAWVPPVVWAFAEVGGPGEYVHLLEAEPWGPWTDAALAVVDRDFARAAEIYAGFGAVVDAAEARVHAARDLLERGDRAGSEAQLGQAIAFYRTVGASRLVRDAEGLLLATA